MEKLTILLIEDTEVHRQAAIEQLSAHNLIVCKDFSEFQQKVKWFSHFSEYQNALKINVESRDLWQSSLVDYFKDLNYTGVIDVVLTDCLMPPVADAYVPQEGHSTDLVPFGPLALLWAIQNNIPKAGMLMLNNHHDHPIAGGLDMLVGSKKDIRKYGNTKILVSTGDYYKDDEKGEYYSSKLRKTEGRYAKEWGLFLDTLIS